jgi:hypothetical protein
MTSSLRGRELRKRGASAAGSNLTENTGLCNLFSSTFRRTFPHSAQVLTDPFTIPIRLVQAK